VHSKQVTILDADIPHAVTTDTQQIIGARVKGRRIQLAVDFYVLLGQYRFTCGDAPDYRQAGIIIHEPYTPRGSRHQLYDTLAFECAQVILGRIRGTKPECRGNFRARRRTAFFSDVTADQLKDFRLAPGQCIPDHRWLYWLFIQLL
jgi:hypothetical protein